MQARRSDEGGSAPFWRALALAACAGLGAASAQGAPSAVVQQSAVATPHAVELQRLGVVLGSGPGGPRFTILDREFGLADDVLVATVPDPRDPRRLVSFVHGNHPDPVAWHEERIVHASKPWLRVLRHDGVSIEAPVRRDGSLDAARLLRVSLDRYASMGAFEAQPPTGGLGALRVNGAFPDGAVEQSALRMAQARRTATAWCALDEVPQVEVLLTSRSETLAWHGVRGALGRRNATLPEAMCLLSGTVDDGGATVAATTLRKILGTPRSAWIEEAAGVDAAGSWWGSGLEDWCGRLALVEPRPSLADLCAPDAAVLRSRHVVVPLRALLLRRLRAERGDFELVRLWRGESRVDAHDAALEAKLAAALDELAARHAARLEDEARLRRERPPLLRFCGALAHDTRLPVAGAGSRLWIDRLDALRAQGMSSVSLPLVLVARPEAGPGGGVREDLQLGFADGDAQVWHATRMARERGMAVHWDLTLQWSPGGSFIGSSAWRDDEERARLFDRCAELVEHAALHAQLAGAHSLSIANSMPQITMEHGAGYGAKDGDGSWKTQGWTRVVRRARRAFAGELCYTAASPAEVAEIGFWKELDRIGYALFPGLDAAQAGRDLQARVLVRDDAQWQLDQVLEVAAREGRPVWLARTGFERGQAGWQLQQWQDFERLARKSDADPRYAGFCVWRLPLDASGSELPPRDLSPVDPAVERAALKALTGR